MASQLTPPLGIVSIVYSTARGGNYFRDYILSDKEILSKVPAVTLGFWIIKVIATTLGETGGDTVTMTMNLRY